MMDRPMPIPVLAVLIHLLTSGAVGCSGPNTGSMGPVGGTATPAASSPASPERSTVSPAAPFPDPEPSEISPRFVKNIAEYGEGGRPLVTIHDATYTLRYQSEALAADVVKAPPSWSRSRSREAAPTPTTAISSSPSGTQTAGPLWGRKGSTGPYPARRQRRWPSRPRGATT